MKKPFLATILISILCLGSVRAQDESSGDGLLTIGVKLGPTFNRFTETDLDYFESLTVGASAGAFAGVNFFNFLTIQGEVLYSLQGGNLDDYQERITGGLVDSIRYGSPKIDFHTVEVPIMAKINITPQAGFSIKPYIGASYSYSLATFRRAEKTLFASTGEDFTSEFDLENVGSDFRRSQISGIFGISFESDRVSTELRYRIGFNDLNVRTIEVNPEEPNPEFRTHTLSLLFGYKIF